MAPGTQTLLEYLISPNPQVNSEHSWTGSNIKSTGNMWGGFELEIWEDFSFETLLKYTVICCADISIRKICQTSIKIFRTT